MKSIKEKAVESSLGHDEVQAAAVGYGFVLGANYVLEEIEKLTNNQNWCAFLKQSHKELKELIEQLKEK